MFAGELATRDDCAAALERYERRLCPFLREKQAAARRFAASFAPRTQIGLVLRNLMSRALGTPFIADLTVGRSIRDDIEFPVYDVSAAGP